MARRVLPLLEPYLPLFVEEPLVPEAGAQLHRVVESTSIPIATGERLYSRWEFRPALDSGIAVVQPDVSHAGGISELRRIAALAEAYDVAVAPHCPLGPISLAASLQVSFAIPNLLIQEQSLGIHYNEGSDLLDYLVDPAVFHYADGHVARPTRPGLGIEVDVREVERASVSRSTTSARATPACATWPRSRSVPSRSTGASPPDCLTTRPAPPSSAP